MKFYKSKDLSEMAKFHLTAIYDNYYYVHFFKNGKRHNSKNAAFIDGIYKQFFLNGQSYGYECYFNKQSWRRFVKLQAFL
jgi:hypothetical protein